MLYNKQKFQKVDCKKKLHKIGKFWTVISIALLGAVGTEAVSTHASANTNVNHDDQANHQINNQSVNSAGATLTQSNGAKLTNNSSSSSSLNSNYKINSSSAKESISSKTNTLGQKVLTHIYNSQSSVKPSQALSNRINRMTLKENLNQQSQTYLKNNEAYDLNSFQRVDGFLTAGSWYRPKMIHRNGQEWVNSTSADYRPILMNWWPSLNTQLSYLNFMQKQGYLTSAYNGSHKLNDLEHADELVQDNVERMIYKTGNVQWLHDLMNKFISSQPQWNKQSEYPEDGLLQGGYFAFQNSKLTPNANSSWRLTGRAGSLEDRLHNNINDMEFLLGNDIDNSNPKVQAEDLNNIYYTNNLGSVNGRPNSNFDGIREDATGSMDYDVTDILARYMKDRYNLNNDRNADAHLNILEDASQFTQDIKNNDALHQDEGMLFNLRSTLFNPLKSRTGSLSDLGGNDNGDLNFYHVNDTADYNSDNANPNYSRVNLHDNDSFIQPITKMTAQLLKENPNITPYDAVEQSAKKFDDGMFQTHKPYGEYYNLPAGYAYLLTNKDTVPEVYYGDMYVGYKPYMSTKTPYYDAISALLKARIKYVAGGQQMALHKVDNDQYESSVRFGKIMNGDSKGQAISAADQYSNKYFAPSTTGIAVVMGNNPYAKPKDSLTVSMGVNHANQYYHPVLLSDDIGISINPGSVQLRTNSKGNLIIPARYLQGVLNPQVSGNLSVWVPNGASSTQDVRTPASTAVHKDNKVYHQNAALDSHVLYESFSPFMPINAPQNEQLDTKIVTPNSINLLKSWGVTDFRFPPHYDPIKHDNSFIDAIDQNGYAFEDRYDFNNTKYGSENDLLNANAKLHNSGIHTLADLVLNQVYDLPQSQVVPVTRTNYFDEYLPLSNINGQLYLDKTISGTNEMQYQYGGKYLNNLKNDPRYRDLFETKQVSTGKTIDPSTRIRQWSAKYMNGSNIQHRGTGYVLQDSNNKYYYKNNLAPEVFTNGIPVDFTQSNNANSIDIILSLIKQRNSNVSNQLNMQDSLANSYAHKYSDDNLTNNVSQINSDFNDANNEAASVDSLINQINTEVSSANVAESAANSYAGSDDFMNSSASGDGINSATSEGNDASLASDYISAMTNYQRDLSMANSNTSAVNSDENIYQSLSNTVDGLMQNVNSLSAKDSSSASSSNSSHSSSNNGSSSNPSNPGSSSNNNNSFADQFYASLSNSINAASASASASISAAESSANSYEQSLLANITERSNSSNAATTSEEESEINRDQALLSTESKAAEQNLDNRNVKNDSQVATMANYDRTLMSQLASGTNADALSPNSFTTDNADKAAALAASVVGNTYRLLSDADASAASASASVAHGANRQAKADNSQRSKHYGHNGSDDGNRAAANNYGNASHNNPNTINSRLHQSMNQGNSNDNTEPNVGGSSANTGSSNVSNQNTNSLPQTGEFHIDSIAVALISLSVLFGIMGRAVNKRHYYGLMK